MNERVDTKYTQPSDSSSMLQFLNPSQDIDRILLEMLGLQLNISRIGQNQKTELVRVNKPLFTDEFSRNLSSDLRSFLNYNVQVSRFGEEDILLKMRFYMKRLVYSLATHGDDAYISSVTWKKIMDIHNDRDKEDQKIKSGWEKFGILWEFNLPVTSDMVDLVKDRGEEQDQAIEFDRLLSRYGAMIHASFNKSYSPAANKAGMLLDSMTEMRTESQVIRDAEKKGFVSSIFGKGEQQN